MPLKRAQWGAPYEETKSVCFQWWIRIRANRSAARSHSHAFSLLLDKRRISC